MDSSANTDVPAWLNAEFFQTILREAEDDGDLVVDAVDVQLAVGKGENFGSLIHKAEATITKGGKRDKRHLMVKSLPDGEVFQKIIIDSQIFQKETSVYEKLLPIFRRLQESSGTPVTPLGCTYYRTSRPHTVVMEDLKQRGFRVADRRKRLNLQHCQLVMRAMARFHALSLGALKNTPSLKNAYPDTFLSEAKRGENHHFQDRNIVGLAKLLETWEGYEEYADKLRKSNMVDKVIDLFLVPNKFYVLCHGDCWLNNMMFKYSDYGTAKEHIFVDFQLCRYSSLTYDIHYFMHSSAMDAVRTKHWDALIAEYYTTFVQTLKSIRYDVSTTFTLDELKQELAASASIGLFTALLVLPIVVGEPEDAPDFTKMEAFDPSKPVDASASDAVFLMERSYSGARYKAALQSMLPEFKRVGVL